MIGWDGDDIELERPSLLAWVLVVPRLLLGVGLIVGFMIPLIILRSLGFWRAGQWIVRFVCRTCLGVIGIRLIVRGKPMQHAGVVVANHSSWLDILSLNACQRVFFVAKSEVSSWPGIGTMAKSVGTVFIRRKRTDAKRQHDLFLDHMQKDHKLLFFPEGTSTDGRHVLPFRSSLFQAFFADDLADLMWVQPVTVLYHAPKGRRPNFYGWWGEMELFEHLSLVLGQWRQGHIEVVLHEPLKVRDFKDRKALADTAFGIVADGMPFREPN